MKDTKVSRLQRFSALVAALLLSAPLSLSAENRTPRRTSLDDLARDLEQVLGSGHVEVTQRAQQRAQPRAQSRVSAMDTASLLDAMNRERTAYGLQPLRINSRLSLAAEDRVGDMFGKHYFDHVAPDGTQPFVWADRHGYRYSLIGENLAVGYGTAEKVVDGWMHSPGHRANILKANFDEIGIAVSAGSPTRGFAGPTVVAMYGTR